MQRKSGSNRKSHKLHRKLLDSWSFKTIKNYAGGAGIPKARSKKEKKEIISKYTESV